MTTILEINAYTAEYREAICRFLNQLTSRPVTLTETQCRQLLAAENSHLFFLMQDNVIAGMLTVGTYLSPTGGKAWIEDVVVDEAFRGRGLGRLLVTHAMEFVKSRKIPLLMLTSSPARVAANRLYQTLGFERKETNVYRMRFSEFDEA